MGLAFVATKRARSRAGLLTLIALTVACITAILSGIGSYSQLAATNALRESLPASSGEESFYRLHGTQATDEAERTAQLAGFRTLFDQAGITDVTSIYPAVYSAPLAVTSSGSEAPAVSLIAWEGLSANASLVAGQWPADEGEGDGSGGELGAGSRAAIPAAISTGAAAMLHLEVGQTLEIATEPASTLTVAAIYDPGHDAAAVLSAPVQDYAEIPVVAAVVPETAARDAASALKMSFTIVPDPSTITASDLPGLIAGIGPLQSRAIDNPAVNISGIVASGTVVPSLETARVAAEAVKGVVPIAVILLAIISAVALLQLARLLASTRSTETTLLGARGVSFGQHAAVGFRESWPVAASGAVVGYLLAVTGTPLLTYVLAGAATPWLTGVKETLATTWWIPLLTIAVALIVLTGTAATETLRSAAALQQRDSGRKASVASFGVLVLVIGAAAFTLWQFRSFGSPLAPNAAGELVVNPVAVPAPALTILAFTAVGLVLVAAVTTVVQRLAAANRGLGVVLSSRQVARRISSFLIPIALITVTVGISTLAGGYAKTFDAANKAAAQLTNGSDVRVSLPRPTVISNPDDVVNLRPYAQIDDVTALSPVIGQDIMIGAADVRLTALDSAALQPLLAASGDGGTAAGLRAALKSPAAASEAEPAPDGGSAPDGGGMSLPEDTEELSFTFEASGEPLMTGGQTQRRVGMTVWLQSGAGQLVPVDAGDAMMRSEGGEPLTLSATVPANVDPERILALDVLFYAGGSLSEWTLRLTGITAAGAPGETTSIEVPAPEQLVPRQGVFAGNGALPDALQRSTGVLIPGNFNGTNLQTRLMSPAPTEPADAAIPVVVTAPVLNTLDLSVGDAITLQPRGASIPARITAVAQTLPGITAPLGALVDIGAYQAASLGYANSVPEVGQVWLASTTPAQTAEALRATAAPGVDITTANTRYVELFLSPAVDSLWIGAIGSLLIGAIALAASVMTLAATRRPEVHILAALGVSARGQSSARRLELLVVGALSIVVGLGIGWATAALTVEGLTRSTLIGAPASVPVVLGMAWNQWAALLLAQAGALWLASWFYGRMVERQFAAREAVGQLL